MPLNKLAPVDFRIWPVADKDYFLGMLRQRELLRVLLWMEEKSSDWKAVVETSHVPAHPHGSSPAPGA